MQGTPHRGNEILARGGVREGHAGEGRAERDLDARDSSLWADSTSGMEVDPQSVDLAPPGMGIDAALGDRPGEDLHAMAQSVFGADTRFEDGPSPQAIGNPAHAGEL